MTLRATLNHLTLRPSVMTIETYVSKNRSERFSLPYLDFVVDGQPIVEQILGNGRDRLPTRLVSDEDGTKLGRQIALLLGKGSPDYEGGRTAMYTCRCGDLDCFGIGARVSAGPDTVAWSDWAWCTQLPTPADSGIDFAELEVIAELPTFTFKRQEFEKSLASAVQMLETIRTWEPPKRPFLWPWQWDWSLPGKEREMKPEDKTLQQEIRRAFHNCDVVGLGWGGAWFPEDEYDTEADRAMAMLLKGVPADEVAARTAEVIKRDWGVRISGQKRQLLADALASHL